MLMLDGVYTNDKYELRRFHEVKAPDRAELPAFFAGRIVQIDTPVADRWGRLQVSSSRLLPAIDGLLAATALHHGLVLMTRNEKDCQFPGLEVVNPWTDS